MENIVENLLKDIKDIILRIDNSLIVYYDSDFEITKKFHKDLKVRLECQISSKIENGDRCIPLFQISKTLKVSPKDLFDNIKQNLENDDVEKIEFLNGYLNIFFKKHILNDYIINSILDNELKANFLKDEKIVVEFSGPNTNKPLHLGHLRNDILGESLSRILEFASADVKRVNIINDRGIHICKSMLAYKLFFDNKKPEDFDEKSDHFVGRCYVKYSEELKTNPQLELQAKDMLKKWEEGDLDTLELWKKMNFWAIDGIKKTYELTNIKFDKYYFESQTYLQGKQKIYEGLELGIFEKAEDSSIFVDLDKHSENEKEKFGKKTLLRGDGTSLYISQDIATVIQRKNDFDFNKHIYVVASEQNLHFKILFKIIKLLGYSWYNNLYHLSYGMVNLPFGKMKSREGTVVDADNLIFEIRDLVLNQMEDSKIKDEKEKNDTALKIAIGSIHYYLLQTNPTKDIIFDKQNSISFSGNTGAYLQYTYARILSILYKTKTEENYNFDKRNINYGLLSDPSEYSLLNKIAEFNQTIKQSVISYNPSLIANYTYSLASSFSTFYSSCPIKNIQDKNLKFARLSLLLALEKLFKKCLNLLSIPNVSKM